MRMINFPSAWLSNIWHSLKTRLFFYSSHLLFLINMFFLHISLLQVRVFHIVHAFLTYDTPSLRCIFSLSQTKSLDAPFVSRLCKVFPWSCAMQKHWTLDKTFQLWVTDCILLIFMLPMEFSWVSPKSLRCPHLNNHVLDGKKKQKKINLLREVCRRNNISVPYSN